MHGHVYAGTTNPATLKQADETIHHLMEDIGDFVVFANNLSLVCTIYIFISKQDRKERNKYCTFPTLWPDYTSAHRD